MCVLTPQTLREALGESASGTFGLRITNRDIKDKDTPCLRQDVQ